LCHGRSKFTISLRLNYITSSVLFAWQKIADIAHSHGALVLVDNSIMSPVLSRPIELGAGMEKYVY
jgi:hypothetical protein